MLESDKLLRVVSVLKQGKFINDSYATFLTSNIQNALSRFSKKINFKKLLDLYKRENNEAEAVFFEKQFYLVYASTYFLNIQNFLKNGLTDFEKAKIRILKNLIDGDFRQEKTKAENLIKELFRLQNLTLPDEQLDLMRTLFMKAHKDAYVRKKSEKKSIINLGEFFKKIDKNTMQMWISSAHLSKIFFPMPRVKYRRRSIYRWLLGPGIIAVRNGCALAVTLTISVGLLAATFAMLKPYLAVMVIAAVAIGIFTIFFGLIHSLFQSYAKGKLQDSIGMEVAKVLQNITEDKKNINKKIHTLSQHLNVINLRGNLNSLKRKIFLSDRPNDTGQRIMEIMKTGVRPDLVTTAMASGAQKFAPEVLKRYWFEDVCWNQYITYLIDLSKEGTPKYHKSIIVKIIKLSAMVNFYRLCNALPKLKLSTEQLRNLANLSVESKVEQDNWAQDKELTMIRSVLLQMGVSQEKLNTPNYSAALCSIYSKEKLALFKPIEEKKQLGEDKQECKMR